MDGQALPCPGGCGRVVSYDAVPSYSAKRERAGKFCECGFPLDAETARRDTLEYGPDSAAIMESRVERAKTFHEASASKPDAEPEPAPVV